MTALYSDDSGGHLLIWTKDKTSRWVSAAELDKVPAIVEQLVDTLDVYFGVGLRESPLGARARGSRDTIVAIPGLWVDIDVEGPGHAGEEYPPTMQDAKSLLASLPKPPTIVISSGGGLHAYWLFDEVWVLRTSRDRKAANDLVHGWQTLIQAKARAHGWKVDSTYDLARVLRLPGTLNHKTKPTRVTIQQSNVSTRYGRAEFDDFAYKANRPKGSSGRADNPDVVAARRALEQLNPDRADEYESWIRVGMALHAVDESLLEDWDAWSRGSSKYKEGEPAKLWSGFDREGGLGLGSLIMWSHEDQEWPDVIPFADRDLPSFPTGALPETLRDYVKALAEFTQTPEDLGGCLALAAVATAVARKYEVEVTSGYREPLNIYVLVAMASGTRKSPVFAAIVHPIQSYESHRQEEERPNIARIKREKQILKREMDALVKKVAASPTEDARRKLQAQLDRVIDDYELLTVPSLPRLVADDATPEKVANMLAAQSGRIAILSSEGHVFNLIAGLYTRSVANQNVFLKGHSGDTIITDRMGREGERVAKPAITMGLTIQPGLLYDLGARPEFRQSGFLARFLYTIPEDRLGHRDIETPPVPPAITAAYGHCLLKLLRLRDDGFDEDPDPFILTLDEDAHEALKGLAREIEPDLRASGSLNAISDWVGKLLGAVARIAGILHLSVHVEDKLPHKAPISAVSMTRAITLGRYFLAHAKGAFIAMSADPAVGKARRVLAWLKDRWVRPTVTHTDVYEAHRSLFQRAREAEAILHLLADYGYVRLRPEPGSDGVVGRPRSRMFEIRPDLSEEGP